MTEQVFVQIKQYAHSAENKITVKDVASILCDNENITNKLNSLCVYKFNGDKKQRAVLSALFIFKHMQEAVPNIEIVPLGETDIVIKYEPHPSHNKFIEYAKVCFLSLVIFAGAAFSIVAFNSDVNLDEVFSTLHEKFNITDTTQFVILEIAYSIGLPIGIMIFYNHFGKKKFTADPTPLEIEMRIYEDDIITSIVDGDNRKEDC